MSGKLPILSLPENWKLERLDRLFRVINEGARIDDEPVSAFIDGVVTLRSNRPDSIIKGSGQEIGYKHLEVNDLVISGMNAHLGGLGISDSAGKCTPVYTILRKTSDLHERYISYYLWHAAKSGYIKSLVNAVRYNSADFGPETIKNFMVPVPPIDEQRRIADYLDRQTQYLNNLIDNHVLIVKNLEELTNSQRDKLIRGNSKKTRKVNGWIGEMNENWKTIRLGHIAKIISGVGFPDSYQGKSNGDYPFMKVADLGNADSSGTLTVAENYVDFEESVQLGARIAPIHTIAFPKVGAALLNNRRVILGVQSIFDNNVMGLVFNKGYNRYWYHVLRSIDMGRIMNPGPVPSIGASQVAEILLPYPSESEQIEIAERLDQIDQIEGQLSGKAQLAIDRLSEYKSSLITSAVTGQLKISKEWGKA
jgi:type I restriction enzyme S subunit